MKKIVLIMMLISIMGCFEKNVPELGDIKVDIEKPKVYSKGSPVLAYSDMESGPNYGWSKSEPNKGIAVSIWGRDLGNTRGDSYVSVGGVKLLRDSDYAVWGEVWPTPFWQRITFWLNETMPLGETTITVTVNGVESNPLPFIIREGKIYFVNTGVDMGDGSFESPFNYERALQFEKFQSLIPGDIVYYKGGAYERMPIYSNGDKANQFLWFGGSSSFKHQHGTKDKPISFIAYPGEKPIFKEDINSYGIGAAQLANDYLVLSGFTMEMPYRVVGVGGNYIRVIGNDIIGMKGSYGNGSAQVLTNASGAKILGNAIHGGRSKNRLDHAIYISGAPVEEGTHVGWNYIYDNNFLRGPEISINHQEDRVPVGLNVKSHFIFSNIVDCNPQRATVINVYDLSYDEGDPLDPEPVFIYNNIFLNSGVKDYSDMNIGYAHAFQVTGDHTRIYNNLFYDSAFHGATFGGVPGHYSHEFVNNMIIMNSDVEVTHDKHYYLTHYDTEGKINIEKNIFYDIGTRGVGHYMDWIKGAKGYDKSINITGENPHFVNPTSNPLELDYSLKPGSPAIDSGESNLVDVDKLPKYAPVTRDIFFRERKGKFDIGAVEYLND